MSTPEQEPIPEAFEKWVDGDTKGMINPQNKAFYRQGAIAAYRHLSSQPSPGLPWVKASERLPEINDKEAFAFDALMEAKWIIRQWPDGGISCHSKNRDFLFKKDDPRFINNFLWLEETPSVQSKPKDTSAMGDNPLNGILTMELQRQMDQEAIRLYLVGEDYKTWEKGCEWLYWALIKGLAKENQTSVQPIEGTVSESMMTGEGWAWAYERWSKRNELEQPIEGEQKATDPWFTLKYVKTVLERGFPVEDIIDLIGKKLNEHLCAAQPALEQPIADKEMPEDRSYTPPKWEDDKMPVVSDRIKRRAENLHRRYHCLGGRSMTWEMGVEWMYAVSLMDNADQRSNLTVAHAEISTQAIQIAGLLASNKEWGEKYAEVCRQQQEAKNLIEGFVRIWRAEGNKGVAPKNIASAIKFLSQIPTTP